MIFPEYEKTGVVYHIVSLNDLKEVLTEGIRYDDKVTYETKYYEFHKIIDAHKTKKIPDWVIRRKAIFASLNYPESHQFHSHTAILAVRIDPKRCWVANENCANEIYEPFVLQELDEFCGCKKYLATEGKALLTKYWETSLSFMDNQIYRYDLQEGYDAEVLIQHAIPPEDIEIRYIISDHRMMDVESWKQRFC